MLRQFPNPSEFAQRLALAASAEPGLPGTLEEPCTNKELRVLPQSSGAHSTITQLLNANAALNVLWEKKVGVNLGLQNHD